MRTSGWWWYRQILVKQWAPRRSRPASGTPLGIEPLEPRCCFSQTWHVTDAAWDVTDHGSLAYALSVASGGDTIQFNQSADTIQSTNLTVTAGVTFDLDGSTSTLTLFDSGAVAIDGNLTIVGGNLEIDAATSVTVAAGVAVSTGQSGLYSGNYNDLTFNSPSTAIDNNVSILAQGGDRQAVGQRDADLRRYRQHDLDPRRDGLQGSLQHHRDQHRRRRQDRG